MKGNIRITTSRTIKTSPRMKNFVFFIKSILLESAQNMFTRRSETSTSVERNCNRFRPSELYGFARWSCIANKSKTNPTGYSRKIGDRMKVAMTIKTSLRPIKTGSHIKASFSCDVIELVWRKGSFKTAKIRPLSRPMSPPSSSNSKQCRLKTPVKKARQMAAGGKVRTNRNWLGDMRRDRSNRHPTYNTIGNGTIHPRIAAIINCCHTW